MTTANAEMFRLTLQGKSRADIAAVAVALFSDNQELRIRLKEFQNASHEMAVQFQQMKDELIGALLLRYPGRAASRREKLYLGTPVRRAYGHASHCSLLLRENQGRRTSPCIL